MNKLKAFMISIVIFLAVSAAVATKPVDFCESQQQYIKFGNSYIPVNGYGVNYYCAGSIGICTYYRPDPGNPSGYAPCRVGTFTTIP
jgi:hypothetical protein